MPGDSFMAGFGKCVAGMLLQEAVLRGSACAAIVVASLDARQPWPYPDDLETFLAQHPGPSEVKE